MTLGPTLKDCATVLIDEHGAVYRIELGDGTHIPNVRAIEVRGAVSEIQTAKIELFVQVKFKPRPAGDTYQSVHVGVTGASREEIMAAIRDAAKRSR